MAKLVLDSHLIETCISSAVIAQGSMLTVKRDTVRLLSGANSQREYVLHPGAVLITPVLQNGNILLERQFRYPLNQVFIELPAGKIDAGESTLVTGQRELLEETGYAANNWVYLGQQHPCIGYSNEVIHTYLARGLTKGNHQRGADEAIELFELSLDECFISIEKGEITDGKTIIALFLADKFLKNSLIK